MNEHVGRKHPRSEGESNSRRLALTLGLVAAYMVAEVAGGILTGSLALLADAGHMLSDVGALGFSLAALRIARRPRDHRRTYGYHRAEVLAAFVNAAILLAISLTIVVEAARRLHSPAHVEGGPMLAVAAGGLLVNLAGLWILHRGRRQSLNVHGAWLHVLTDTLGSIQAMIAGFLIWRFGWYLADPIASVLIAILVAYSGWGLLKEAANVLMEGAPGHIAVSDVEAAMLELEGVYEVHDLHVWTITSGFVAMSAHVTAEAAAPDDLLWRVREMLQARFRIEHSTIQLELASVDSEERADRQPSQERCGSPPCS